MIEEVDPKNGKQLFEIDKAVIVYLNPEDADWVRCSVRHEVTNYCTSRDALKAIRPERVSITVTSYPPLEHAACTANFWSDVNAGPFSEHWAFKSPELATEELAELHAIIQAIQHNRKQGE